MLGEPLRVFGEHSISVIREKVLECLAQVGLSPEQAQRYPHMFSGGQRQRIGIARALITRPEILVCDEPVSALDVSIQAQIINLLQDIRLRNELSIVFISHDLSVVRYVADRIMVMYLGRIVEIGNKQDLFDNPQHPYTQMLLASAPGQKKIQCLHDQVISDSSIKTQALGEIPSPLTPPSGCAFHPRCSKAVARCRTEVPKLEGIKSETHLVSCFQVNR